MAQRCATLAEFKVMTNGEFDSLGDPLIQLYLDCACTQIKLECWKNKSDCAHIFLTGHYLSAATGDEVGPVTKKKIDKIEADYADTSGSIEGVYATTKWGRMYIAIRNTLAVFPLVARARLPRRPSPGIGFN